MINMASVTERCVLSVAVCMLGLNGCYRCGNSGHVIRDFPNAKNQAKADTEPQRNPTASAEPPKRNRFYALNGKEEQEKSADMVTGYSLVFSFPLYALLDP